MNIERAMQLSPQTRRELLAMTREAVRDAQRARGVLMAAEAAAELKALAPSAVQVRFEGPQEPGSTATILEITGHGGTILFRHEELMPMPTDPNNLGDDLVAAQDYLTAALDDGFLFDATAGGDFLFDFGLAPDGS